MRTDGQTDMTKLIFSFRHVEKDTKNRGFIDQLNTLSFSSPVPVSGHITIECLPICAHITIECLSVCAHLEPHKNVNYFRLLRQLQSSGSH